MATSRPAGANGTDEASAILQPLGTALLVVALLFGFALLPKLFTEHAAVSGKPAPEFSVEAIANVPDKPRLALSELRGKVVILDFWATWCGPCKAQSPVLDSLQRKFQDRGLVVVGMNTNDGEGNAKEWAASHGVVYPIVYDQNDTVAHGYNVNSFPTLFVIDREGKIAAMRVGFTSSNELEGLVKKLL
jgi:cytochrome c biogenesis protein CcmG/thiol:disulfide interchange protein DsbE